MTISLFNDLNPFKKSLKFIQFPIEKYLKISKNSGTAKTFSALLFISIDLQLNSYPIKFQK